MPFLLRADAVARGRDTSIVKVTVNVSDDSSHLLIATSEGLLVEDDRPMALLAVSCVAEKNGATETGYANAAAREDVGFFSDARIARIASRAADDTMILFDAVPAPVGEVPVVLAPGISAILLHEAMGHGMEADFARKGTTIYSDRIGQRIAPADVTIIDDAGGNIRGSINIDDEGTPGQRTVLVENGILRSFLHDRISARHFGVASTGSGRRESFRSPPLPRMRNTVMLEGPHDPGEIIASVPRGLYAEVFSNGQVNIGAGDFTFYLKHGRLIENGKLGPVVKDANLIGSGPKVLESVVMVGRDVKVESSAGTCGKDGQSVPVGFGMPTTKVGAISVGGRAS
jgi:TldD protein